MHNPFHADWKTQLTETLPPEFQGSLPTIEEIEAELSRDLNKEEKQLPLQHSISHRQRGNQRRESSAIFRFQFYRSRHQSPDTRHSGSAAFRPSPFSKQNGSSRKNKPNL